MDLYLVTGTTRGLGAALAARLAADPGKLCIGLSRAADGPHNVHLDLADPAAVAPAFASCVARFAGHAFDRAVLINNAGVVTPVARFDDLDAAALSANVNVNLVGPMLLAGLFARATGAIARRRLVVNISSGAARKPIAGWSAYCAAKAGLDMATRVAAQEAGAGLAVCSLAPGVIDTPMQATVRSAGADAFPDVARFRGMKADGTLRPADDVARDILHLIDTDRLTHGGNHDIRELMA